MTTPRDLVHRLRNTPVRKLISALTKDGFVLERQTRTGGRIYAHADGRIVVIHSHHGSDTLTRKTLESMLTGANWTEDDLLRLGVLR